MKKNLRKSDPNSMQNLKSLASAFAQILEGNIQILGSSIAQGHVQFSSACDFMKANQLHAKFEVDGFICDGHIKKLF